MADPSGIRWPETLTAVAACLSPFLALWLGNRQMSAQEELARKQLAAQREVHRQAIYLQLTESWRGTSMVKARKNHARGWLSFDRGELPDEDDEPGFDETVIEFLEDLGLMLRKHFVDRDMVYNYFAYAICGYWAERHCWIRDERERLSDQTFYDGFEYLVHQMDEEGLLKRGRKETEAWTEKQVGEFMRSEVELQG